MTHTIDVSDGTMRIDPPFFILNGFTSNTALDIKEGKEADHPLSLYLNARSGIEECILTTSSSSLISQGWPAYIDLADLSTDKLQLLQSFGLQLKGLGANKDKIATIDFTNVIPHIEYDNGVLSTFKLVAKDKLKKVNKEEVILAINSLSNQFAVVTPAALRAARTSTIFLVFGASNARLSTTMNSSAATLEENADLRASLFAFLFIVIL